MSDNLKLAIEAAFKAGGEILRRYENYELSLKEDKSPLTSADLRANEAIFSVLSRSKIPICSEERVLEYRFRDESSRFWLVDPLDGTKEFIAKSGEFCVCIALIENSVPSLGVIFAPMRREIFYSCGDNKLYRNGQLLSPASSFVNVIISGNFSYSKKVKSIAEHFNLKIDKCGSALKFCYLASGRAGLYARFCGSSLWDTAAGDFLLSQSGGVTLSLANLKPLNYAKKSLENDYFIAIAASNMAYKKDYLDFLETL